MKEEIIGIGILVVTILIITTINLSIYWAIGMLIPLTQGHFWLDVFEGVVTVFGVILMVIIYSWLSFLYPHNWTETVITKILRNLE